MSQGGIDDPEGTSPTPRIFASAEHNIDVFAAFRVMTELTGESVWDEGADHARQFVEAMWETDRGCYLAGTPDPGTRNTEPEQLPADVQAWSLLAEIPAALQNALTVLGCAESNHRTTAAGFSSFDFNEDRDGVWFEGTGHMATAYALLGQSMAAADLGDVLRGAQHTTPFGDGYGIVASSRDELTTGFGFKFFRRLHVAATSWLVFAQLGVNPYYLQPTSQ